MVLNPAVNIQNNGCGTISKCSGCMYKLICDKSPYCVLGNDKDTDKYKEIQEQLSNIMSGLSTINNNVMALDIHNQKILSAIDVLQNTINSVEEKTDKILKKIKDKKDDTEECLDNNIEEVSKLNVDSSDIVPYTEQSQDATVLVEKKNIFGKSKWVEKKI